MNFSGSTLFCVRVYTTANAGSCARSQLIRNSIAGCYGAQGAEIMCFSATASFTVAAMTAAIGVVTVKQVRHPRAILLAAVPLLFAFQQTTEGFLWLQLSGNSDSGNTATLSLIYLIFAEALWPTYLAVAVLFIEPDHRRRLIICFFAVVGAFFSTHLLLGLLGTPPVALIRGHSIGYYSYIDAYSWPVILYLTCVCTALLISTHRIVQVFGAIILIGYLISAYVYFSTFISVWCFFAAADSTLLYFYFKRAPAGILLRTLNS